MTKLQLALDSDLPSALQILTRVHPYIDIIEIGTPLIFREGMRAIKQVRALYPDVTLLADLKIMDAGQEEAHIAFSAGANIVTVMGVTHDETIQGAIHSAKDHQQQIMIDMMCVSDPIQRANQLLQMGCDVLCVHTAYDLQSSHESPYQELNLLRQHFPSARLAIAGGIQIDRLDTILPYHPDIIIVGGAITRTDDPARQAEQLYERIQTYANS